MTQPGWIHGVYREHRIVGLRDWQGLGFSPRISDLVAQEDVDRRR